ncbi:prolyl oligopeptidase family serine peptidase [Alkalibacillus aidingensis]|uniref:prolyl oligopeptidase family serine peptidase n=1 Tax=Alkalibacillus aidingensis TaxID=2747607 RepID=UPI001661256E|nr:prolyl oligopeptidase family serine peptidase [Alkalibacillus aidingensis]
MAVVIEERQIEHIPTLIVHNQTQQVAPLPVIVYFHGFTSAKEQNLSLAYLLADIGYRVVLPDAMHHGARRGEVNEDQIQFDFWKIVEQNLVDLHMINSWLIQNGLVESGRLGIAGTSMGGMTTAAALTQYSWIQAVGMMMGSAKAQDMARYLLKGIEQQGIEIPFSEAELETQLAALRKIDLSEQPESIDGRPLFIWHGDQDPVVPFSHAQEFFEELEALGMDEHVEFVREHGRDHKVSRQAMLQLTDWFKRHL